RTLRLLTHDTVADAYPAWSPDGTRIAFARADAGSNFDIYTMAADGSDPVQVTSGPEDDTEPAWSPDGALLALVRAVGEGDRIYGGQQDGDVYTVAAAGGAPRRVTSGPELEASPAWAPAGTPAARTRPACSLLGTKASDRLAGSALDDRIFAEAGRDVVAAGA